ncbi:MAG: hypothetical protein ACKVUS_14950 [Saprospiraceae bacterium]
MSQPALPTAKSHLPTVDFHAKPQPSFNKNLDLLIRHLHEMKAAGYETYICSENPKQFDRLKTLQNTTTFA